MPELRRSVQLRGACAAPPRALEHAAALPAKRSAARAVARLAIAPFAAAAAAVAGLVFVVLLPICGIASLAEGFARACWGVARRALPPHRGAMPQY